LKDGRVNLKPGVFFQFDAAPVFRQNRDMGWRAIALVSLAANVILAGVWLLSPEAPATTTAASSIQALPAPERTNVVVRRQFFSWQDIESADYPLYIAKLRLIGCPEQTIRDIIIADVNSLYARRRATELVTSDQQWWRAEPDTNVVALAAEKARALDEERRALLTRLLGSSWEAGDLITLPRPSRPGILLDGPVLGVLPSETKQAVQEINHRLEERVEAYLAALAREGRGPDPAELAKLRQQTRDELARVLAPPQLEEYLLRYSQTSDDLRTEFGQLQFFNPTPEEFRAVFRATDALNQRIQQLTGSDPNTLEARRALEEQKEQAMKLALGADRYQDYIMLQDPLYREAMATASNAGTPEAARTIYEINRTTVAEENRIRQDPTLTAEQKNLELKRVELEQMRANTLATGQELPPEPPAQPAPPPRRTYVISPGDSAAVVSLIYGVPVQALREANPNVDLRRLRPGDTLNIPPTTIPPLARP
jgi:murein DD-endopeptidase MepM/ murein hydrolase activator NlpD